MVQELVDKGMLSQQEAEHHPRKNVITRAVGVQQEIIADVFQFEWQKKDVLLLCSDGLTNALELDEIEGVLRSASFYDTAERLIERVLQLDEQDNTTVVLIAAV
jgi:protein phosphatase